MNPGNSDDRSLLHDRAQAALRDFQATDSSLATLLNSSQAYVIFPRIMTAAVGVGGAYGKGEVYQKGKFTGFADVTQGSVGAQLGGQKYAELILFRTEVPFVDFTHGTFEFDVRASAILASNGAAKTADYSRGVLVFTMPEAGAMFQASIGGQQFHYTPATQ